MWSNRIEFRGGDVRGREGGRRRTGATIHKSKVRFTDVKQLLFEKFISVKKNKKKKHSKPPPVN